MVNDAPTSRPKGGGRRASHFTPFRIENAQSATPSSLITARKAGVLNEKRCKGIFFKLYIFSISEEQIAQHSRLI